MNKRQRKKRNKNWAKSVIIPFYEQNEDGTTNGLMYSLKNGKIVKAYKLINTRLTAVGDSHLILPDQPNEVTFESYNPYINGDGDHINKMAARVIDSFKAEILSKCKPQPEINPQIWEYGGIKRFEYLFFRYCVQWYTTHYKEWAAFTIYDLAEQYVELYPKNNLRQLLYYIYKWQNLRIVNYTLRPYKRLGIGSESCMIQHYRKIWNNAVDSPKEQEIKLYETLFRPQEL